MLSLVRVRVMQRAVHTVVDGAFTLPLARVRVMQLPVVIIWQCPEKAI